MRLLAIYARGEICAFTAVSDEDFDAMNSYRWRLHSNGYPQTTVGARPNRRNVKLHKVLFPETMVDHINGDKLDNRRENLRSCTKRQNGQNVGLRSTNTSGFKGVYRTCDGKWCAQMRIPGQRGYLGLFNSAEEAARAYDNAAREHFGEFARTNFTEEP